MNFPAQMIEPQVKVFDAYALLSVQLVKVLNAGFQVSWSIVGYKSTPLSCYLAAAMSDVPPAKPFMPSEQLALCSGVGDAPQRCRCVVCEVYYVPDTSKTTFRNHCSACSLDLRNIHKNCCDVPSTDCPDEDDDIEEDADDEDRLQ